MYSRLLEDEELLELLELLEDATVMVEAEEVVETVERFVEVGALSCALTATRPGTLSPPATSSTRTSRQALLAPSQISASRQQLSIPPSLPNWLGSRATRTQVLSFSPALPLGRRVTGQRDTAQLVE